MPWRERPRWWGAGSPGGRIGNATAMAATVVAAGGTTTSTTSESELNNGNNCVAIDDTLNETVGDSRTEEVIVSLAIPEVVVLNDEPDGTRMDGNYCGTMEQRRPACVALSSGLDTAWTRWSTSPQSFRRPPWRR
ncbi:hypothetical protein PC117_g22806 [Phytophthora cactorum]|uniref:Uncharacterized protein n=1 Tax=Phytophthora cactorum TaxID=29920 RepID=A0A8T1BA03_9STRA|nr:hypothetical protein PC117_g22806 [Phytophthora cactorum]KAG4044958.1 hypothetical protein PC123_g19618 [Phytophthora cactorum]